MRVCIPDRLTIFPHAGFGLLNRLRRQSKPTLIWIDIVCVKQRARKVVVPGQSHEQDLRSSRNGDCPSG